MKKSLDLLSRKKKERKKERKIKKKNMYSQRKLNAVSKRTFIDHFQGCYIHP